MPSIFPKALTIALACCLIPACNPGEDASQAAPGDEQAPRSKALFNGENLDGWSYVTIDRSITKEEVWSARDGILVCQGEPLGYLHTDTDYLDYKLELEWRWAPGTEPTNSGVLLRIAAEPETFLPKCVEAQLKHGRAGDLYGFYGAAIAGDPERFKVIESEQIGTFKSVARIQGAEKPPGEWNHYEITIEGGSIEVKINGELVNRAHGLDLVSGPIGLQSEGSEIHFRNIVLSEIE